MAGRDFIYLNSQDLNWQVVDVRGTPMQEAPVLKGEDGIYSAFYKLPKGTSIARHRHVNWVQVMVLKGAMSVLEDGRTRTISEGGCYVVPAGGIHFEQSLEDTLVLVTSPDP